MRFVTHCPSCGSSFKVVADQLRIAQGWVRCGHCQAVYKAVDTLVMAEDDAQAENTTAPVSDAPPMPSAVSGHETVARPTDAPLSATRSGTIDAQEAARQHQATLARIAAVIAAKKASTTPAQMPRHAADTSPASSVPPAASAPTEPPADEAHTLPAPAQAPVPSAMAQEAIEQAPIEQPSTVPVPQSVGEPDDAQPTPVSPPPGPIATVPAAASSLGAEGPAPSQHVAVAPVVAPAASLPPRPEPSGVAAVNEPVTASAPEQAAVPSSTGGETAVLAPEPLAHTSGRLMLLPDGAWQFAPLSDACAPQPVAEGTKTAAASSQEPTTPAAAVPFSPAAPDGAEPVQHKRPARSDAERRARHERRARRAAEKATALAAAAALSKEELSQQALEAVAAARSEAREALLAPPDARMAATVPAASDAAAADLSFVRAAQRRALWQRPAVRGALALVLVLGMATLAGQWLFYQRASIYAQVPLARTVLDALCQKPRCNLPPWKNIDAVSIESSNFRKLSDRVYRLSVSLGNASPHPVAMPALEVSLLNDDEQVVARRVLANDAALPAPPILTPRGEWNGSVLLDVRLPPEAGRQAIAGYRLAIFYP